MKKNKKKLFTILSFILIGCIGDNSNDDFYTTYKYDDLWRLPLLKPYQLINTIDPASNHARRIWGLEFKNKIILKNGLTTKGTGVTKINIVDSIIYGRIDGDESCNPCFPFIINLRKNTEKLYQTDALWMTELKELKIDGNNTFEINSLFGEFKNNNKLPWNKL
jgi:hypothetical protein